ncbi:hypothetical protein [Streptomyces sp. NPDC008122]|uniref:GP88 family protein n=1 Tax=Streptomyces sp. NPDC008122 TaxID=3364810 RepID=UPI0036EB93B8
MGVPLEWLRPARPPWSSRTRWPTGTRRPGSSPPPVRPRRRDRLPALPGRRGHRRRAPQGRRDRLVSTALLPAPRFRKDGRWSTRRPERLLTQNSDLRGDGVWNWTLPTLATKLPDGRGVLTRPSAGVCALGIVAHGVSRSSHVSLSGSQLGEA